MRTAKAALVLFICASLEIPASGQTLAAGISAMTLPRGSAVPLIETTGLPTERALVEPLTTTNGAWVASAVAPDDSAAIERNHEAGRRNLFVSRRVAAPRTTSRPILPRVAILRSQLASFSFGSYAATVRSKWENLWSGSLGRSQAAVDAEESPSSARASSSKQGWARRAGTLAARIAAAAPIVPPPHVLPAFAAHAEPFLKAGAIFAAAYAAYLGVRAVLNRFARRTNRQTVAAIRLVTTITLLAGAIPGALIAAGAPAGMLHVAVGAGATILTLGLQDILGNAIQGATFLFNRPFPIGARVQIGDKIGTVSNATMTQIFVAKDAQSHIPIPYASLLAKTVVVFGKPVSKAKFFASFRQTSKLRGAMSSIWKSLDRPFWLTGATVAALAAAPHFVPFLTAGMAATILHYALPVSIMALLWRADRALIAAMNALALKNSWATETTLIARLAINAALLMLGGGGTALEMLGSLTTLSAGTGVTIGLGLAFNKLFGPFIPGIDAMFITKPFKIGDVVQIGKVSGVVEDMTSFHAVLALDAGRYALVPYAAMRDELPVVTPQK